MYLSHIDGSSLSPYLPVSGKKKKTPDIRLEDMFINNYNKCSCLWKTFYVLSTVKPTFHIFVHLIFTITLSSYRWKTWGSEKISSLPIVKW